MFFVLSGCGAPVISKSTDPSTETTPKQSIASREQLIAEFDEQWAKKRFPKGAYKYFKAVIDGLYDNYDAWREVIPDLPDKDTYIREHAINSFSVIKSLQFGGKNSRLGKQIIREGGTFGSVDIEHKMVFVFTNNFYEDVKVLAHEWLGHCYQSKDCFSGKESWDDLDFLWNVVVEGGATMHMKLCSPLSNKRSSSEFREKGDLRLEYQFVNGQGYQADYAFFMHLQHLIGYERMDRAQNEEQSFKYIKQALVEQYGIQAAEDLFAALDASMDAEDNHQDDDRYDAAEQETRVVLQLLKQDIQNLNSKEEVSEFFPMYRAWKTQCIPQVFDCSLENVTNDITSSYFNFDELDALLIEKMQQFAVPQQFSADADKNREALQMLLYNDSKNWGTEYNRCFIPVVLYGTEYNYSDAQLHITFVDLPTNRQYDLPEDNVQRATLWMENGTIKCRIVSDLSQLPDLR